MSQTKAQLIDPVDGTIVNADINASAAIAGSKISPNFGSQTVTASNLTLSDNDPIIQFTDANNDPDYRILVESGIFRVQDTTNGNADRLAISSSGNVGIGTNSPNYLLDVEAASGDAQMRINAADSSAGNDTVLRMQVSGTVQNNFIYFGDSDDSNAGQIRYSHTNNFLSIHTNASEVLRIDSSGRLLLGTTTVGASNADELTLATSGHTGITIRSGTTHQSAIYMSDATSGNGEYAGYVLYDHNVDALRFGANTSDRMRIDSSGRLLIGHTSSIASDGFNSALQVNGTSGDNSSIYQSRFSNNISPPNFVLAKARSGNTGTNGVVQEGDLLGNIQFHGNDGSGFHQGAGIFAIVEAGVGNDDMPTSIGFATNSGSTSVGTKMRLSGDGRLTAGDIDSASTSVLHLRSSTDTETTLELSSKGAYNGSLPSGKISFTQQNATEIARIKFETNTGAANRAHIAFWTNFGGLAERMRILDTGQVGIGNSIPSSFHSSGNNLVVGSGSGEEGLTIYSGNTSNGVINFADSTSGSDSYEGRIVYSHNNNHMTFNVADGSESMRLVSGGRLFVGCNGAININGVTTGHTFQQVEDYKWILGLRCEQTNKVGIGIRYGAGGSDHDVIIFVKDSTVKFVVHSSGNVANANNSYGQTSDVSLKENIVDANSQWNDIKNVKVRNFNFKAETGLPSHTQIGVVAQEIETTSPKLVTENEQGIKEVGYSVLYMKAIKALQEAMTRIETLETEVAALKAA